MDGPKDSIEKVIFLGIVVPAALIALIVWNLAGGFVFWPIRRALLRWGEMHPSGLAVLIRDAWIVWGTAVFKLGIATAFLAFFGISNSERWGEWTDASLRGAIGLLIVGLGLLVYGFLR